MQEKNNYRLLALILITLIINESRELEVQELSEENVMTLLGVHPTYTTRLLKSYNQKIQSFQPWTSDEQLNKNLLTENNINWMANIPDELNIEKLAIPGTHDSCTFKFIEIWDLFLSVADFFGRTQRWNLTEQMEAGIRYLDLRVNSDGNIYHGPLQTTTSFRNALEEIKLFLISQPTEGFIIRIKFENNTECIGDCLETQVRSVLNEYQNILLLSKTMPTMGQLRGKIFPMVNFEYLNAFNWEYDEFILQDYYDLEGEIQSELNYKKALVSEYMSISENSDLLVINHCSAMGAKLLISIKDIADSINEVPYNAQIFSGIIPMDYPSEELINRIIRQNNRYMAGYNSSTPTSNKFLGI